MTRGIIYTVWGSYDKRLLDRSIASAKLQGYDAHVQVLHNDYLGLSKKVFMYESSPFESSLYLDADTKVVGNLDYGFEMAEKYALACCIAPASSAFSAEPNSKAMREKMHWDTPQINTGVLFFHKPKTKELFDRWKELINLHPESAKNDQITFSQAVYGYDMHPFILPRTWNFRKGIRYEAQITHGEMKIIHSKR